MSDEKKLARIAAGITVLKVNVFESRLYLIAACSRSCSHGSRQVGRKLRTGGYLD